MNLKKIEFLVVLLIIWMCIFSCRNKQNGIIQSNNQVKSIKNNHDYLVHIDTNSIIVTCRDYDIVETKQGLLTNNVWNKKAAGNQNWSQCIIKKTENDSSVFGWSWSWPKGKGVIYGYPQIKIGASPWTPGQKFDDRFPMKISLMEELMISFDVEVHSSDSYNLAASMWLIFDSKPGLQENKSNIAAEVMFWTYKTIGLFNPAGHKIGEVNLDDEIWEVWVEKNWKDTSGVNKNRWVYIAFKSKTPTLKTTIKALELLQYAIRSKIISDNLFIADVELGNEVMGGEGVTWVKKFKVDSKIK